jgi:hypothetical protein
MTASPRLNKYVREKKAIIAPTGRGLGNSSTYIVTPTKCSDGAARHVNNPDKPEPIIGLLSWLTFYTESHEILRSPIPDPRAAGVRHHLAETIGDSGRIESNAYTIDAAAWRLELMRVMCDVLTSDPLAAVKRIDRLLYELEGRAAVCMTAPGLEIPRPN